jgi:hypothetical protein
MATNLIQRFKNAKKNDNFRAAENPVKYNNKIAQLNSLGDNQYQRLTNPLSPVTGGGGSEFLGRTNTAFEYKAENKPGPLPMR